MHLTPEQMSALHDGALKASAADEASRHVAACAECRAALDALIAGDAALAAGLEHDPGDAFFERLAEKIDRRIADEASAPAPVPARDAGGLRGAWAWLMSPRGLAMAGAAAVVVVGGAIVLITARQTPLQDLRDPKIVARGGQVEPRKNPPAAAREGVSSKDEDSRAKTVSPHEATGPGAIGNEPTPSTSSSELAPPPAADRAAQEAGPAGGAPSAAQSLRSVPVTGERRQSAPTDRTLRLSERERAAAPRRDRGGAASPPPAAAKAAPAPAPIPTNAPEAAKSLAAPPAPARDAIQLKESEEAKLKREESQAARGALENAERPKLETQTQGASPSPARGFAGSDGSLGKVTRDLLSRSVAARLCGVVRDASARPISGAEVAVSDLGRSTRTSADGRFCIDAPAGDHTVTVMAVGFETQRRALRLEGTSAETEFTLRTVEVIRGGRNNEVRFDVQLPDSFAAWPEALRDPARAAERRVALGIREHSASRIDQGAAEWERVLVRARDGEHEVAVRERIAEARYVSWEMSPTPARARAAIETLTSYLTRAPMGPARERAAQRLDRVRR